MLDRFSLLFIIPKIVLSASFRNMSKVPGEPPHPIILFLAFREKKPGLRYLITMERLISKPGMLITLTCHDALSAKIMKSFMKTPDPCKEIYERRSGVICHA